VTGGKCHARQRHPAPASRNLEFELASRTGQHDEAPLGAGHFERRVHDRCEDLVEHFARAERAQTIEHRGDLTRIEPARGDVSERCLVVLRQKHQLDGIAAPQADPIAVSERSLRRDFPVYQEAVSGAAVAQHVLVGVAPDFGVIAGNLRADDVKVAGAPAADRIDRSIDGHNPAAQRVGDLKARVGRGQVGDVFLSLKKFFEDAAAQGRLAFGRLERAPAHRAPRRRDLREEEYQAKQDDRVPNRATSSPHHGVQRRVFFTWGCYLAGTGMFCIFRSPS